MWLSSSPGVLIWATVMSGADLVSDEFYGIKSPVETAPFYVLNSSGDYMACKSCASENQREFPAEFTISFATLQSALETSPVYLARSLCVCLDCGFTEVVIPETELRLLADGAKAQGDS